MEHGVTELCYDIDLVTWMVCLAYGCLDDALGTSLNDWMPNPHGHAMQVRVYAEDPAKNFQPSQGVITSVEIPTEAGTRVDTGVYQGTHASYTGIFLMGLATLASQLADLGSKNMFLTSYIYINVGTT